MSTLQAIWGNKLAPGALDHFLASTAYDGQQTDEPRPADTTENLWELVPGAHSTRGDFDDVAQDHCYQALAARHKKTILIGTTGVAAALLTGLFVLRN